MSSVTKFLSFFILAFLITGLAASTENILRDAVIKNGFKHPDSINPKTQPELVKAGKIFFNSTNISLNGDTSCQTCHLDKFGSADGIPNAIGVGGEGEGAWRIKKGGAVLPRNALPLWGRGIDGFDTLFWDGRVEKVKDYILSQFGESFPSNDPLVVAAHLPPVEIREMLVEDKFISDQKQETYSSANQVFNRLADHARTTEAEGMQLLAEYYDMPVADINYLHIAESIAEFIRAKFAVQESKFHDFVFNQGALSDDELSGAMLFYGKGKCSTCHSGPLLSDLDFHAVPFPQLGYGKNGFGIDYGKYNSTHNPSDLYKFRTPPLLDVDNTFPYSHSGGVDGLKEAIIFHFDPLRYLELDQMSAMDRTEFYKRLSLGTQSEMLAIYLNDKEVDQLIAFLKTLSFNPIDI
jgi:cytochrome c peroxidase